MPDAGASDSSSLDAAAGSRADARGSSDAKRTDRTEPDSAPDSTAGESPDSTSGGVRDSSEDTSVDSTTTAEASPDSSSSTDGGVDASLESGADSTVDTGSDAHVDTGSDSPTEAGLDSPEDTEPDSHPDAPEDTGPDSPADTGKDGTPGLVPCITAGQTDCVQCQGNATTLCSPTEAQFVQHDIDTGVATAAGPDPENDDMPPLGSCYACLLAGGCIDDTTFGDTDHECEDVSPPFAGSTTVAECETVLTCILGSGNGTASCASAAVSGCYCGTAPVSGTCQGNPAPGPINGACAMEIAMGLAFPVSDGTDITKNFDDTTKAAGRADQIFQCAQSNGCAACY